MKGDSNNERRNEFASVIDANKGLIYKVVNAYCRDQEDQKDLVQEIIIQLWNAFDQYDDQYKISTWLYRISLNVAISFYRKSSARQKHTIPMEDYILEIGKEEDYDQQEEINMLRKFIQELDKLNRALIILYLDGNSHSEIADILNISASNVGTKINRIKTKLKQRFKEQAI